MTDFFKGISPVKFEGPTSTNPLAYRFYNKDEMVLGKRMEDHIRPAVAYWHTFAWEGGDPFGGRTFDRPWYDKGMEGAKLKADVAFELFDLLDVPFFCFHDADVAPEGATLAESNKNLRTITDIFAKKMQTSRTQAALGHGEPLLQPPLHGRRRHQPRPGRLRLCRRPGEEDARDHPRAGRRQLRAVGRPRGLRDAAQHRHQAGAGPDGAASSTWSSSTPRRSASRARS